jgi:electron transport complex protein RnfG
MNQIIKDTINLTLITLVAGLLLGAVYKVTEEPIATAQAKAQTEADMAVFETASSITDVADFDADAAADVLSAAGYDDTIERVAEATDASGEVLGYVISVTDPNGYGGDVTFSIGITMDGTINGIAFTTLNETAGLGMKAKDEAFSSQFNGMPASQLEVVKDGATADNQVQAISGATITSKAVTGGCNAAITYFNEVLGGSANE